MTSRALSRRGFIAGTAGAALGIARVGHVGATPPPRAVVVGAGLAGLTTALDLVEAGWDTVVLEARDRVGGRVHTHRFDAATHAELGGESIDDNHHDLLAMVARFGLATERRDPRKPLDAMVYRNGTKQPLATLLAGPALTDYLRFQDALAAMSEGVDPEHPERAPNATALDAQSLESFIVEQALVPAAEFVVRTELRGEFNAEARDLSLLFMAQQAQGEDPGLTGAETMRIAGGNDELPRRMADALGDRVRRGHPVSRIRHGAHDVVVDAGGASFTADQVVLALPAPPLREVAFDPPLPPAAAAMVAGLDLGTAAKVVSEYSVPFWLAEGFSGFTLTDLPFGIGWSPTDSYTPTTGLLSQFITGDGAVSAAAMSDVARLAAFGAQLDEVYPEGAPLRTGRTATMAWANEPFTGGGYAIFRPGQMASFWPVLREGVGRIHFAGEHTEPLIGYMESAVRSGHRVAAQLVHERRASTTTTTVPSPGASGDDPSMPATGGAERYLLPATLALGAGVALRRRTRSDR